jgi:hypothetical protein
MDDVVNRLARELADTIAAAVVDDPRVEACREKARAAGYEMRVSLEAVIGFASRSVAGSRQRIGGGGRAQAPHPTEMSANDRRFLRSLRIAVDEDVERKQVE